MLLRLIFFFSIFLLSHLGSSYAAEKKGVILIAKVKSASLKKQLDKLARNLQEQAKEYGNDSQISYWQSEGKNNFAKLLRSIGYYQNNIEAARLNENSNAIIFNIDPGPRYEISDIQITFSLNSNRNINYIDVSRIGILPGYYAIAENVVNAEKKIIKSIEEENCLLNFSVTHEAKLDNETHKVSIKYIINSGPNTHLEKVEFVGLKTIKEDYARKLVALKDGQCIKKTYIDNSRTLLQQSGHFSSTAPIIPEYVKANGMVPIGFNITERKPRSVKAGVAYDTDLGLGANFGWEHRNFFGSGEQVKTGLFGNQKEQIIDLSYTKPFFKQDNQKLIVASKYENRKTKAFLTNQAKISATLERQLTPKWTAGLGGSFLQARVTSFNLDSSTSKDNYSLGSVPLYVIHDTRNNVLNPKRGKLIELNLEPFFFLDSASRPFVKSEISGSTYFHTKAKFSPTIAVKAAMGTIIGSNSRQIPRTEMFYVGGNNSLRGYGYQLASDIDPNKRPIGGRSFLETSVELRLKATDTIGIVTFWDTGYAYLAKLPQFNGKLLQGVGLGFRYMTTFGPLRFDVGFPLKRRKFIDKSYQIYFGIGQSF